LSFMF